MRILVTNDDGIDAIGLKELARSLTDIGEVVVVAPSEEKSAISHAITMHHPLRISKIDNYIDGVEAWSITGTPSDCVKIAIETLLNWKPDIVISGINNGGNLGTDVIYSGTVSAAIEGALHGISAIAVSAVAKDGKLNYKTSSYYILKLVKMVIKNSDSNNFLININIPSLDIDNIKGIKVTELGVRKYDNSFIERKDPLGRQYYWLSGSLADVENKDESDIKAVEDGFISITPLQTDLTNYNLIEKMKTWI
ncbi:5'-nucleotidase SurE [Gottschalkia purinilytica]|uniref:5'-nucleotidase SurE n=1 Tax=Gottschalkia purinilytica TaxID=1503 RepID=A0A0L0W819_GOTPU|nr:5'/3'-nucleotidase SurE [Gottschalkia purinilytica]KNF07440.1 5'-nucleotidase SurE [Gottschalkia purinilytica]